MDKLQSLIDYKDKRPEQYNGWGYLQSEKARARRWLGRQKVQENTNNTKMRNTNKFVVKKIDEARF